MSSSYGENLHITLFGQSHSAAVGVVIDGLAPGEAVDTDALRAFMQRRAPGRGSGASARSEADEVEFLSGLHDGVTCGAPLCAIIRNTDVRREDYAPLADIPRPGHADFTAQMKFHGAQDASGGGHFSGRLTAPLCVAGGICLQILSRRGISVISRIASIADVADAAPLTASTAHKPFPAVSDDAAAAMLRAIDDARSDGDSVGGVIECAVLGVPAGLGDPIFDGMENRIASAVFGIPAVKGIEFGSGFASSALRGSRNNDAFVLRGGAVVTETNHCGGILGGITTGMPLTFRAAVKPTPSIAAAQKSVDLSAGQPVTLSVTGRHDACIVPRAVPCVESAAAIAVYDALLSSQKYRR